MTFFLTLKFIKITSDLCFDIYENHFVADVFNLNQKKRIINKVQLICQKSRFSI